MERTDNTVLESLKAQGLRVTPQRYAVYANLLGRTDHPTVDQLMTDLNQEFPISSQATVYNSLRTLLDVGLVREVLLEEGVSRYDANTEPHHHFQCQSCGAIEDIPWDTFPALDISQLRSGLVPERYEVTVLGQCDRCSSPG
ncbi:transcriptional repressor [filamentous cyanobacterium CCP5]|nr:transcriptional repressor [filamentous cyanobacterium CCP5]